MATMVWRVTPTFSASAACVISPAWKRSVRTVLAMRGSPLPISVDPVVEDLRRRERAARQHRNAEQRIGSKLGRQSQSLPDKHAQHADREYEVAVAHRLAVDQPVALIGPLVGDLPAARDDCEQDVSDDHGDD